MVCINNQFLHFQRGYILVSSKKKLICQRKHNHSNGSVWVFYSFFAHAGLYLFTSQKNLKEIGKFWRKCGHGTQYSNPKYSHTKFGKLKTFGRKKAYPNLQVYAYFRDFFQSSLSVWKRIIKKPSYIKVHWSSLRILCSVATHTYTLSNCEPSKHIQLSIILLKSTLETESQKPSPSNPIWKEQTTFLKVKISLFYFCYCYSIMMTKAHQKSSIVVFLFCISFRLKRRRVAMVLEVWLGNGFKWISSPALHIAMGSPAEKTFISLTTFARELPDSLMEP